MKITPVKGTSDFLPSEAELRDYLQGKILDTYRENGFMRISTPAIEDIENLDKSEGGDNLNLIFKILKRGDKFDSAIASQDYAHLSDMGLRYDLTLPLSRFYANNKDNLPLPFKCIQIDKVYRAERPQKGRMREFTQCDIDIIGSSDIECEVELISTTTKALRNIDIEDFRVRINDRRILKKLMIVCGYLENELDGVSITFDKLDKIGVSGVQAELEEKGFTKSANNRLVGILNDLPLTIDKVQSICGDMNEIIQLNKIISMVKELSNGEYEIDFDISLVRGQGYYTGAVFEIQSTRFNGAIAGGGRYDNLIGKFLNTSVPAVGFSIGFERICGILSDIGYKPNLAKKRIAVFYNDTNFVQSEKIADKYRSTYLVSMYKKPNKLGKFLSRLEEQSYYGFAVVDEGAELKLLGQN